MRGQPPECRLCVVKVDGVEGFPLACTTPVTDGMNIHVEGTEIKAWRQDALAAILGKHPHACLTCSQRNGCSQDTCSSNVPVNERCCWRFDNCELRKIAEYVGMKENVPRYSFGGLATDKDQPLYDFDYNLCIGCTRCVRVCQNVRGVGALGLTYCEDRPQVGFKDPSLKESGCRFCGACVEVCPTGAIRDKDIASAREKQRLVSCSYTCPAGMDVPRYVRLIKQERLAEALSVIRAKVPFPRVLSYVCQAPCESQCRRGEVNEPISIRALKRFATDHAAAPSARSGKVTWHTGKKVAVVGGGPAGLTAAFYLARKGHSVTVFEALPDPGGMMRVGIPEYRLPRNILEGEVNEIRTAGVEIKTNARIDDIDSLFKKGYQAVFVATGAHSGVKMGIEGEDLPGVTDSVDFLRAVALGHKVAVGNRVAVIGGGNSAIDAARTAIRLGAKEVTLIYRRTRAEMPASHEEVGEAINEGVKITFLAAPTKISKALKGWRLECTRTESGNPDSRERRSPQPVPGTDFAEEFDTVIGSIGQRPDIPSGFNLRLGLGNTIMAKPETLETDRKGVYAGGDAVSGPASVVQAIAQGRSAATAIDRFLGGDGVIDDESPIAEDGRTAWLGKVEDFAAKPRDRAACLPVAQRTGNFTDVEQTLDLTSAIQEAERCLECDLRLEIPAPVLPPEEWLDLNQANLNKVAPEAGVYWLSDDQKAVISIKGTADLRQTLDEQLSANREARYFKYERDELYTARESELLKVYLEKHGALPRCDDPFADF